MTILQQVGVVVIFMPHFRSIAMHTVCGYRTNMKLIAICFREVQVKDDFTDNNNKHYVTAFEGGCRNIIELREHLKLCFLVILRGLKSNLPVKMSMSLSAVRCSKFTTWKGGFVSRPDDTPRPAHAVLPLAHRT